MVINLLRYGILFCIFLYINHSIAGQSKLDLAISYPNYLAFDRNTFDAPRDPFLLQLFYKAKHKSDSEWLQFWSRPRLTVQSTFIDTDENVLGKGLGFSPGLEWSFLPKGNRLDAFGRVCSGLIYMSKKYDLNSNTTNNAIGSHINNLTTFNFGIGYDLEVVRVYAGYQLTHISNGRTSTPNTGLNFYGFNFGITKNIEKSSQSLISTNRPKTIDSLRHFGVEIGTGLGFNEYTFRDGPKYNSYYAYLGLGYRYNPYLRTIIGLEYEYNESVFQFYNQDFVSRSEAMDYATRTSIALSQVLRFGYIGVRLQGGFYLPYPALRDDAIHPNWLRLSMEVYFRKHKYITQPYIGVGFKTHKAVAQYVMIYGGVHI
jgi:hypothetical protein